MTVWHILIAVGFAGGVIGGMGLGGGTLLIPLLTMCGVEQHLAQAINLTAFIPMSITALIVHRKNGYIDFKKSLPVSAIALVSAILGSLAASYAKGYVLRACFGGFLVVLGIVQTVIAVRKIVKDCKDKKAKRAKKTQGGAIGKKARAADIADEN